jgi:translation initiation factor IF-1
LFAGIYLKITMPRNTTGGKNFKKFKSGGEGFRAKASREAADGIVGIIVKKEKYQKHLDGGGTEATAPKHIKLDEEEQDALKYLLVGRVVKRLGNGRNDVYCHDGNTRQCVIRGLLRKKGQVFIDIDSLVVVSLRSALSSSDEDETGLGPSAVVTKGDSDIVGLLGDSHIAMLKTTNVNKRIFVDYKDGGGEEDLFDRSDEVNAFINNNKEEKDIDIDDI